MHWASGTTSMRWRRVLALHPAFLPTQYAGCEVDLSDRLVVRLPADCAAVDDGAWPAMIDSVHLEPLDALVRAVDARYRCDPIEVDGGGLTFEVVMDDAEAPVAPEVTLTRFSTGADFQFEARPSPVAIRPRSA